MSNPATNVHDDKCVVCKKAVDPTKQAKGWVHDHCEPLEFWPKWKRESVFVDREKVLANRAKAMTAVRITR